MAGIPSESDGLVRARPSYRTKKRTLALIPLLGISLTALWFATSPLNGLYRYQQHGRKHNLCPQQPPMQPQADSVLDSLRDTIYSADFNKLAVDQLSRAVQIHTESYDEEGAVGKDDRWDRFYGFAKLLEEMFPLVHNRTEFVKVNTHGLLWIWHGSTAFDPTNEDSKPLILMAHQDVVPVNEGTIDQWDYPPFSGHYDGEWLHGRGAGDCKTLLISTLEGVELLLQRNYQPKRTIIILSGFDEESAGLQGAGHLYGLVHARYGSNGVWAILDEGSEITTEFGLRYASVSTAEKGHLNVNISLAMAGGHSSVPPPHTSIGVISAIIQKLEANPDQPTLATNNPFYTQMQCLVEYAPNFPSPWRRTLADIPNKINLKKLVNQFTKGQETDMEARKRRYSLSTSQAVDIIQGGVKSNALPEFASVLVNYRIALESSVAELEQNIVQLLRPEAEKWSLTLDANGKRYSPKGTSQGLLRIESQTPLEPAPVTNLDSSPWRILSGTIRNVYNSVIVSPGIGVGNTDTRSSWDWNRKLTNQIFRWSPAEQRNIHTVNERVKMSSHIDAVYFVVSFIRNAAS